jgi:hypothetical protein
MSFSIANVQRLELSVQKDRVRVTTVFSSKAFASTVGIRLVRTSSGVSVVAFMSRTESFRTVIHMDSR